MAQGSKAKYTAKQKREARHIADSYAAHGNGKKEAKRRAWATVNAETGGGKQSGSGRGKPAQTAASKKSGKKGGKEGSRAAAVKRTGAKPGAKKGAKRTTSIKKRASR